MRMRTVVATFTAGLATITCLTAAGPAAQAQTETHDGVSHACSPLVNIDGFSDALDKTTFDSTYVGNLSALAVDTEGRIAALSDRSSLFTLDAATNAPMSDVQLADESGAAPAPRPSSSTATAPGSSPPRMSRPSAATPATASLPAASPSPPPSRSPRPGAPRRI